MGRGGKVLKSAKKSVALARITDSSTASTPSGNPVPSTSTAKTAVAQQSATSAKQKTVAPKRKTKAKPKEKERVTQTDYAQRLQTKFSEAYFAKKHPADLFLKGKTLFYYAPDHLYASEQTMRRMDIIVKAGGILLPTFDPERITHIVTEAGPFGLLGAIGLRSLREIPDHIHTVKWSWVVSGMGNGLRRPVASGKSYLKAGHTVGGGEDAAVQEEEKEAPRRMAYEVLHAAFASRLGAGPKPRASSKEAQNKPSNARGDRANSSQPTNLDGSESSSDFSGTSEFTQGRAFPGQSDPVTGGRHAGSCVPLPPPGTLHMGDARPNMSNAPYGASIMAEPTTRPCNAPDSALSLPTADDPLAEFYEQARAERDAELEKAWNGSHESDDGIDLAVSVVLASNLEALGKRTFACDNIGRKEPNRCPNQDVVDKLTELRDILKTKGLKDDHWRIISYNRGIGAIKAHPKRIKTLGEARAIRCVGERTAQKIMEILETGELQRIKYERTPDFTALKLFIQIYGAGPYTARKWFAAGCRTLEDVKSGKGGIKLSSVQKIGLEHYADINMRMPRSEASDIFSMIKPIALSIDPELFIEIMGSYRRGKADCGDIDILISRRTDDGKTHRGVFRRLLEELHRQGIITEDLCVPDDFDDLELIYRGLCRKQPGSPRRRIDFLTVPYQSTGAALLYYTVGVNSLLRFDTIDNPVMSIQGDDMFNRSMRLKANVMGYSLNQRGLYAGVIRDPDDRRQKLHGGHIVASETEQEIFAMLGVPWQEPHQRIRA
ncbi:hypothetical protein B0H21DRAFT_824163 [Amylocystis lapponica]|nr:hypothetical protein B0H21DRAFT_824163 [Amylocystis lapponica]